MTPITYKEIYSKFFSKVEAYDLFSSDVSSSLRNVLLSSYIHTAISDPFVRKQFSALWLSDPSSTDDALGRAETDGLIEYELVTTVDEQADNEFVLELISSGVVLAWVDQKLRSITNMEQLITSSDSRFFAQSSHLQALRALQKDTKINRDKLISDRNFIYNRYLDGDILNRKESSS